MLVMDFIVNTKLYKTLFNTNHNTHITEIMYNIKTNCFILIIIFLMYKKVILLRE